VIHDDILYLAPEGDTLQLTHSNTLIALL